MATSAAAEGAITDRSLEDLPVRTAPAALHLAYFLTGDHELARDLVQDAFVWVAGRFQHLRRPDAFDAYLRRTIVNLFTSLLRRRRLERGYLEREQGKGTGGGFGLMARPVGAYVVKDGRATWKPAVDLGQVLLLALVAVFGMRSVVRACAGCCAAQASASSPGARRRSGRQRRARSCSST